MATTKEIVKSITNILLGCGVMLVFNENPENLVPNFIGMACFGLLIYINKDDNN